jgi:uncharacterized phiE125 gp8 family phage protein
MPDLTRRSLQRTVEPTSDPVGVPELAEYLRLPTPSGQDALLQALVVAATQAVEAHTGRSLMPQTWRATFDRFPDVIELPQCPVVAVSSIAYTDTGGTVQTLSASLYRVDTYSEPCRITPIYGGTWPTALSVTGSVVVTFTAGYLTQRTIPQAIRTAILAVAAALYEQPEAVTDKVGAALVSNPIVDRLLYAYTLPRY